MRNDDTAAWTWRGGGQAGGGPAAELTPERIAEVRRRILEGAYSSPEVAGRVARQMLRRGDV